MFEFTAKDNSWIGVGVGKGMLSGNDMIMCSVGVGFAECFDYVSIGNRAPKKDSQQDLEFNSLPNGDGSTKIIVKRLASTGDSAEDSVIELDKVIDMAWSVNSSSNNLKSYHTARGDF